MKNCSKIHCSQQVVALHLDLTKPTVRHLNPQNGLTSTISYSLIYSDLCFYHLMKLEQEKFNSQRLYERKNRLGKYAD